MTQRSYKIGHSREQVSLLPPCIEDYVGRDNPVRAIDAYIDSLDLNKLDFRDVGSDGGAGQPPYDPADLLKLYLYGYLHQVRSSRRLERQARCNTEVMWLLRGLTPGYRTIANFRKDNAAGLRAANREFVLLARSLDLLGGELVAIDGAFFHGDASKASILTKKRLQERMAALDRNIAEYHAALTANDQAEETAAAVSAPPAGADIAEKLAALRQRRATAAADLATLADSGDGQLSRTDRDARLLAKHGQIVAGYNVQIAVDAKHNPGVRRGRWSTTATTPANSTRWPRRPSRCSVWRRSPRSPTPDTIIACPRESGGRGAEGLRGRRHHRLCAAARSRSAAESAGPVQRRGLPL